jgi:hypothetical protein
VGLLTFFAPLALCALISLVACPAAFFAAALFLLIDFIAIVDLLLLKDEHECYRRIATAFFIPAGDFAGALDWGNLHTHVVFATMISR